MLEESAGFWYDNGVTDVIGEK